MDYRPRAEAVPHRTSQKGPSANPNHHQRYHGETRVHGRPHRWDKTGWDRVPQGGTTRPNPTPEKTNPTNLQLDQAVNLGEERRIRAPSGTNTDNIPTPAYF